METNISIDVTITIVTTSAATLDYGIDVGIEIVIVAMHVIAASTDRAVHPPVHRTTTMVAASPLGVGFAVRIITDPVITFAMAATFMTETNTRTVLNGSTAARVLKGQRPSHDGRPRQGASRCTFTNLSQRDGTR
jgi:hypothetical protein